MISDKDQLRVFALEVFKTYQNKWVEENFLLSRRFKDDNIIKNLVTLEFLQKHFQKIKKVAICHTSDSVGLIYLLRKKYNCEVVVITNHPLFDRIYPILNEKLGTIIHKKIDCVFENFISELSDCDLVIFPEMEYYVPLNLIKNYNKNNTTLCLYYIDDLNNTTEQSYVLCREDMEEMCSFNTTVETRCIKNVTGRDFYFSLGIL